METNIHPGFVFVTGCELQNSPKYGGEVYHITFQDLGSETNYYTYAVPGNRNYSRWLDIIKFANLAGIVLHDVSLKDPRKGLIDADSKFTISDWMELDELADLVIQARKKTSSPWDRWFE